MTARALLFTDVVDSTLVGERLGDARAAALWTEHDRRARDLLARHHGLEIGRSDGLFVVFDAAADAARFALGYHAALAELALAARVGIHMGPVTLRENTPEHMGLGATRFEVDSLATPVAARLMSVASGGQTLMSATVRAALGDAVQQEARIERHGHYRLKGVEEPVEVFELGARGQAPFAPPAGRRQGVSSRARRRLLASRARRAAHVAGGARCLRRQGHGTARARGALRRGRATRHRARPRWDGQDAHRSPLWLELARRLAWRRLFLRPVRRAFTGRDPLRGRHRARSAARSRRSVTASRQRHRRARTLPRHPRQLRAGGRTRAGHPGPLDGSCSRRRVHRDQPGAASSAGRGDLPDRATAARDGRHRALRDARSRATARLRAERRQPGGRRRSGAPARRLAARDRTGGGPHPHAFPRATRRTDA